VRDIRHFRSFFLTHKNILRHMVCCIYECYKLSKRKLEVKVTEARERKYYQFIILTVALGVGDALGGRGKCS
jgi:uncharacterized membrane-anchored protein